MVRQFDTESKQQSCEALVWFLSHGGDIDIKDGDGVSPRQVMDRLESAVPEFGAELFQTGHGKKEVPRAVAGKKWDVTILAPVAQRRSLKFAVVRFNARREYIMWTYLVEIWFQPTGTSCSRCFNG